MNSLQVLGDGQDLPGEPESESATVTQLPAAEAPAAPATTRIRGNPDRAPGPARAPTRSLRSPRRDPAHSSWDWKLRLHRSRERGQTSCCDHWLDTQVTLPPANLKLT